MQLTEPQLRRIISCLIDDRVISHGQQIPKASLIESDLKEAYDGQYDQELAEELIRDALL